MADRPPASDRRRRRITIALVALLLGVWVFLYRFNTLGGAFGGFDNDHFLYFAIAKQVEAGEQPLRDFQDGVHGAWPSLTYELSAAAQKYFGDNLRSEAWLTVFGMSLGITVAFVAASIVAAWPWALATTLLAALMSPKLYGYPKVLVTAVAVLIIVSCRGLPTWRRVAIMSAWSAIAFLFRHDYVVYCVVGFVTLIVLSSRASWQERATRLAVYGALILVLLAPSLWWIQRYAGLSEYVRNALEMSQNEAYRTTTVWPRIETSLFGSRESAIALVYYLIMAVPVAALCVVVWRQLRRGRDDDVPVAAVTAISLMTIVLWHYFLRGNLGARFGDIAAPVAVLGAYLLSVSTVRGGSLRLTVSGVVAVAVLALMFRGVWRVAEVGAELGTSRLLERFAFVDQAYYVSGLLVDMPRSLRQVEGSDRGQASDYLNRCTRPTDRVIAVGYYPDVPALSGRLFAGGRVTFVDSYYTDPRYAQQTIAKLESQSVPIVLGGADLDNTRLGLVEYFRSHYDEVGTVAINEDRLRVLVKRGLKGTPSGPNGLPCFG
jgi:hypothetical protein